MKYQPHDYQNYATQFIIDHPVAAILLQMGLGKSVITLTAIQQLPAVPLAPATTIIYGVLSRRQPAATCRTGPWR